MNSSILAIATAEIAFLGIRREEWVVELHVYFQMLGSPILCSYISRFLVPTCIFNTVAFNRILGSISTLILFLKLRQLILSLKKLSLATTQQLGEDWLLLRYFEPHTSQSRTKQICSQITLKLRIPTLVINRNYYTLI